MGAFGKKPVIPDLPTLNIGDEQLKSIKDNLAALPYLTNLANQTNRISFDQINKMLDAALPGFRSGLQSATTNAASLARGELPSDVQTAVQNSSAARSLSGGYGGSALGRNLTLRDLGLTSLQATGEGQNRLQSIGGFTKNLYPQFDFTTAFISPMQRLNFDWQQNLAQYQVQLMKNQVAAAPDPAMAQLGQAFDNFFETWKNVGMGALGGMGGGGMGGMMGGMGGGGGSSASSSTTTAGRGIDYANMFGGM